MTETATGIVLETIPEQATLSIRSDVPSGDVARTLSAHLTEVVALLARRRVEPAGRPFARYHEIRDGVIDLECGLSVAHATEGDGRVGSGSLPGGRVARTTHVGPYHALPEAYERVRAWLRARGLRAAAPFWEVYVTDPSDEPDAARWRTDIYWPVEADA